MREYAAAGWIAIVDDDDSLRRAMVRFLGAYSFQVQTFPSGYEFLTSLQTKVPDCLIVDLQMDGMTGLELLHRLSGMGMQIPTIVVTATNDLGTQHRCEIAGAIDFLVKPVSPTPLLQAIGRAMRPPSRAVNRT